MRHCAISLTALAVVLYLGAVPGLAQHGHGGGGPGIAGRPSTPGGDRSSARGTGRETPGMGQERTVGELLTQNTKLSSKLQGLLPAGTDLQAAARGFKNLGQFVAAVHVSNNLGIPFDQLKAKIMSGDSLGKAIHELNPNVNPKGEAKKAKKQAHDDMKGSSA